MGGVRYDRLTQRLGLLALALLERADPLHRRRVDAAGHRRVVADPVAVRDHRERARGAVPTSRSPSSRAAWRSTASTPAAHCSAMPESARPQAANAPAIAPNR